MTLTGGGRTRSTETIASGQFTFSALAPGRYQINAAWGTECFVTTRLSVAAGKQAHLRLLCFVAVS